MKAAIFAASLLVSQALAFLVNAVYFVRGTLLQRDLGRQSFCTVSLERWGLGLEQVGLERRVWHETHIEQPATVWEGIGNFRPIWSRGLASQCQLVEVRPLVS